MNLDHFQADLAAVANSPLHHWLTRLPAQLDHWSREQQHGELKAWLAAVRALPVLPADTVSLGDTVSVAADAVPAGAQQQIHGLLKQLMPWRKGPFHFHGVTVDTEWRSDFKWQRVAPHIGSLSGQVLDVGCGSGYHLWRMLEAGAEHVWGIDPGQLFLAQFLATRHFMPPAWQARAHYFPLGIDDLGPLRSFDTVFSMGVLYHRRSPIDFLSQLHDCLNSDGRLVLETLVVEGDQQTVLVPGKTYAKMRNVWFIPSTAALVHWLERCRFKNIQVVDESLTTIAEQRATPWMDGQSLAAFLDPNDASKTIEGYPAPRRAVIIASV